jgi:hypothetical protein
VTLTCESLERRLLACRWAAENSRGPSNSKVISRGCPSNELLSHPTHLLSAQVREAQVLVSAETTNKFNMYTNIIADATKCLT